MIYFVQPEGGGPIKIGCSDVVDLRRQQLEWHYGRKLVLLATTEGGFEEERRVHERFAGLRFGNTEQFRPGADLLAHIGLDPAAATLDVEPMEEAETTPRRVVERDAPDGVELGRRVRSERERIGLTQVEAARLLHLSRGSYRQIEDATVLQYGVLVALVRDLGMDARTLAPELFNS